MVDYPLQAEAEFLTEEPYNAGNKEHVNKRRAKEGRQLRQKLDYMKTIMSTSQGREWIYNLLEICKVFNSPIVMGDTHFTYHNIGEQNIGKKLLQDINQAAPDEYIIMMKEARERQ